MFKPVPNSTKLTIQGITCYIPPFGFGTHNESGEPAKVDVIKRSSNKKEQYWEVQNLPEELEDWKDEEDYRKLSDPEYVHPDLLQIKQREWHRRLYGVWFWNNGEPVYLTGVHYFYLNYWNLDTGLPDYRLIDLEYFYFWQCTAQDPRSMGIIEIRKRRDGKSYRSSCILYETISRSANSHGGIQSKNFKDGEDFFQIKLVSAFKSLPFFFIPEYDTSKGDTPKESLSFFRAAKKGKGAKIIESKKVPELKSSITFKDRGARAYDGRKLKLLVLDESGKVEINVMERHAVVKYCLMDNRRRKVGNMIVTSTVEEIGIKWGFKKLWDQSDQYNREKNGTTKSGLYRFFISSARSGDYDKYGTPDEKGTLAAIQADRENLMDDPDELNAIVRKEPLSEKEAFIVASHQCHFNPFALNQRLGELTLGSFTERGNFVWKNGERDTEVEWMKSPIGRWEICSLPDEPNKVKRISVKAGDKSLDVPYRPLCDLELICGADTIDIDLPKDEKRASKPAAIIKQRYNHINQKSVYNNAYVCKYIPSKRMKDATEFYEDLIKMLVYYGCSVLYERNKSRLGYYLKERGYAGFLITLPGEKEPGVHADSSTKPVMLELLQHYVKENIDNVYFTDVIEDWLKFDINDSTPNDLSMASGWCEYGDKERTNIRKLITKDINDFFKLHKVG